MILIIDGDPAMRRMLAHELEAAGRTAIETWTIHDALRLAATNPVSAVIIGPSLGDEGAADLCRSLRGLTRVPIVAIGADSNDETRKTLLDAGATYCVTGQHAEVNATRMILGRLQR